MVKFFSARDCALVLASASLGLALGLYTRLPATPDMNNLLGLIGSLSGAAIAVVASLVVLARQFETNDDRQLRTIRALLNKLRDAGVTLTKPKAPLDPAKYVKDAFTVFHSARNVATQLQASGPAVAIVAQSLTESDPITHLHRSIEGGAGVAGPELQQRGTQLIALADHLIQQLREGL